jgi:twitching motility two-component system response regulator PilH
MAETAAKILIVEDDQDTADTLKLVLEREGYEIVHALDAADGLAKARAERPNLVLLDVMMPTGVEGFHFVWDLRKEPDEALRETPILIMTAIHQTTKLRFYPEQSDGQYESYEYLPVQGFLDKPLNFDTLLEQVQLALEHKGANPVPEGESG